MEVDIPEVKKEVEAAFALYETALVTNDVATLEALFRNDSRTLRYEIAENLYGMHAIREFRRNPLAERSDTQARSHDHHDIRPRLCNGEHLVLSRQHAGKGRPPIANVGAVRRRLAHRCGACQHYRHSNDLIRRRRCRQERRANRRNA